MVYTSGCLLLLCYGSSGSFIALEEEVQVVVFSLWPLGLQGCERGKKGGKEETERVRQYRDSIDQMMNGKKQLVVVALINV